MEDVVKKYVKEDSFFLANEYDPDLMTIKIALPSLVDWYAQFLGYTPTWEEAITYVDGYGLDPKDQFFKYTEKPERIRKIADIIRVKKGAKKKDAITNDEIYVELDNNRTHYKKEIEFIKKEIKRRYHGYWFFNNGKPTYIDGWHYFYLNEFDITNNARPVDGLPDYRDSDRRMALFTRYCYTTKQSWHKYKVIYRDNGNLREAYFNTIGSAENFAKEKYAAVVEGDIEGHEGFFVERNYRTVYGKATPKRRRRGATSLDACIAYLIVTEQKKRQGGLQSFNEEAAKNDVFADKLIRPWKKLPFYHKPTHDGTSNPKTELKFTYPAERTQQIANAKTDAHDGWIMPRSATERAFDGNKLYVILRDEGGKIDGYPYDLNEWWSVHKKCLAQAGAGIHGLALIPSTVGEMDNGGGKEYARLLMNSKWEERDGNGHTVSGLVTYMEAAYDGLDGYIDKYGMSIIDDPILPVETNNGTFVSIGAKTFLTNTRKALEQSGDMKALISEIRDYPWTLREALTKGGKDSGFDMKILRARYAELEYGRKDITYRANLEWRGEFGSEVEVVECPDGKFVFSRVPDAKHPKKPVYNYDASYDGEDGYYMPDPLSPNKFIIGVDPFAFNEEDVAGRKKSNGGIAVFYHRDMDYDTEDKPKEEWISGKFVCTYSNRVEDKDEFVEDVLKLAILYNSFVYPEMNVPVVSDKFKEWGYRGYLLHDTDEFGQIKTMAGRKTTPEVKENIFSDYMNYIRNYGKYENHKHLIKECIDIGEPSEMTNYDLFTAGGYCFLGSKQAFPHKLKEAGHVQKYEEGLFGEFYY